MKQDNRSRTAVWLPWIVIACLSLVLLIIGIMGRRQVADTVKLQQALFILQDPATRDTAFGGAANSSRGRVFLNPGKGVIFIGANLPRLDSSRTFELWLIPAKGNPLPQGVFTAQPDATAVFVRAAPVDIPVEVTVTVEPEGGSPQPTNTPFIVAKVPAL